MESGLSKAFYGVYNSSKEIIKNNQRDLFCNMLELLARTTRTTGVKLSNVEEFVLFWATDILPLIFDEDKDIQRSAIAAMETVAGTINFQLLHNFPYWNDIKTKIVQHYSKEIYKYREASNSCWYKIWCILIRILDKEIIKGASTINTFLSIVELGFRSSDYNVRAEAFQCWKVLIEIYANNDEINSPKRIRLICIPLKSSHSKTTQAAVVKFKVWWFLITKLNVNVEHYVDSVLEPFLTLCYGSVNRNNPNVTSFKEMSVLCLISLMGSSSKMVKKRMEFFDIDSLSEPLINNNIMLKSWKLIISYSLEAIRDCEGIGSVGSEFQELTFRYLLTHVIRFGDLDALYFLVDKLQSIDQSTVTRNIQKFVENYEFESTLAAVESDTFLGKLLSELCTLLSSSETESAIDAIVKTVFQLSLPRIGQVLEVFLNGILHASSRSVECRLITWKLLSMSMVKHFDKRLRKGSDPNLSIVGQWIIWPLKVYSENQSLDAKLFDDQFGVILEMTAERLNDAISNATFLKEMSLLLQKLYNAKAKHPELNAYFSCFIKVLVASLPKQKPDEELLSVTFNMVKLHLNGEFNKTNFELCMKCLKSLVAHLGESGIEKHFDDIKDAWSQVINHKRNNCIEKSCFEDHRKQFLDDVKKVASRSQFNKIKNYLENDDLFVIIPAVWSLNPDKLTERQKEKFYEKSDIPALYNDMSQSQDAFIKPWTPKKLVIAKGHVEEIAIGESDIPATEVNEPLSSRPFAPPSEVKSFQVPTVSEAFSSPLTSKKKDLKDMPAPRNIMETSRLTKVDSTEVTPAKNKVNVPVKAQEEQQQPAVSNCRMTRSKISSLEEELPTNTSLEDYVEQVDAIILKDTSSPPDRKQTNNSTSPVLKPKTTHLTGRGAQLINMIRNKKHDAYSSSSKPADTSTPISKMDASREKMDSFLNWSGAEGDARPSPMNLLVFSKTLPSPCASPSASILKRKHTNESLEEIYDSQALKRKRVSFHDPPVSITKEYLKDDENKNHSKRCLLLDQDLKGATKHLLRRSAKIENQSPIEQLPDMSNLNGTPVRKIKYNQSNCEDSATKPASESPASNVKESFPFLFRTETDVLNYVVNQFSMEDICSKMLSDDKSEKAATILSKFISNYMNASSKFKSTILDTLSEKYPKEFLDYAIQENLSSVVCDRLNSNVIVEYICSKAQTNATCRTRLFQETQDILNQDKLADERYEFIQKAITSKSMSDEQLLCLIEMLFESRRKHQRAVSESAIDSSSTL